MKNVILALLLMAIAIPTLTAQPAGYDENFRKIGEHHNAIIKYLLKILDSNPTYNEVLVLSDRYVRKVEPETQFYKAYQTHSEIKQFADGYWFTSNKANYLSSYLPAKANTYVNQLASAARLGSHSQRVAQFEAIIENIIADSGLETSTKNTLLYGAATGISSSALWSGKEGPLEWKNAPRDGNRLQSSKKGEGELKNATASSADDESIIEDDVTGAIAGGVVGGIAGGLGAPVTGTGGAIIMGGGGSVKTGLKKLWRWIWD